jgi:hypothetical protein
MGKIFPSTFGTPYTETVHRWHRDLGRQVHWGSLLVDAVGACTFASVTACDLFYPLGGYASLPADASSAADASSDNRASSDAPIPGDAGSDSACVVLDDDFTSGDASAGKWFPRGSPSFFDGFAQLTPYAYNWAGGLLWNTPTKLDAYHVRFEVASIYVSKQNGGEGLYSTGVAFVAMDTQAASVDCQSGNHLCELGSSASGYAVALVECFAGPDVPVELSSGCEPSGSPPLVVTETSPYPDGGFLDGDIARLPFMVYGASSVDAADAYPPEAAWVTFDVVVSGGRATVSRNNVVVLADAPIQGDASFEGYWGFGAGTSNRTRQLVRNVRMAIGPDCSLDP